MAEVAVVGGPYERSSIESRDNVLSTLELDEILSQESR